MSINFVPFGDIIEANGKTIRENNHQIPHMIPLGALVEVVAEDSEAYRMRAYVIAHTRDCDGTPLYWLGHRRQEPEMSGAWYLRTPWLMNYSEASLKEIT
jgi:hypothetical protein